MIRSSLFALALLAAACSPAADEPVESPVAEAPAPVETPTPMTREEATAQDTCGAAQYSAMIGQNIAAVTFPADSVRVISPGQPVTEDFRADRLNVLLDDNGVITALECY